jgi:hypothetical protein
MLYFKGLTTKINNEDTTSQGWSTQYDSQVLKIKKINYLGWKENFIRVHDLGIKRRKRSQKVIGSRHANDMPRGGSLGFGSQRRYHGKL